MDQNALFLAVLIIGIAALAVFSGGLSFSANVPSASPPNPDAEFGVVREQRSLLSFLGSGSSNNTTPPPSTTSTGSSTQSQEIQEAKLKELKKNFSLSALNVRTRTVNEEYIQILYSSSAKEPINVTNWTISNTRGETFPLGMTTTLPAVYAYNDQNQLIINPGARLYVITGRSPLGYNFQLNKCMPYLSDSYKFVPSISASCPQPRQEAGYEQLSDTCYSYIRGLSSCRIPTSIPFSIDNECRDYIARTISYAGCVNNHKKDSDFYQNSWWTYLQRPTPMWSDIRDVIILRDGNKNEIKSYSYN